MYACSHISHLCCVNFTLEQVMKAQIKSRIFNLGARWRWAVNDTPQPPYSRERDPVPIVQEAGCFPGPVWTGAENLAYTGIRSPTVQPVPSRSACPTCLISVIRNTNYEAPHYAVFLVLVVLCLMS